MLKIKYTACIMVLLSACQSLPEQFEAKDLALTAYQNEIGEAILPVPKSAGEKRRLAWEKWLHNHRDIWNTQPNQTATGKTRWCAQWQQNGEQRICNRNNQTLVWFDYGQSSDKSAIEAANKIWIGR
ncbi:hypothetical protein ACKLNO_10785 [Neisseriaceae bacterium B1]